MKLLLWLVVLVSVFGVCLAIGAIAQPWVAIPAPAPIEQSPTTMVSGRGELLYTLHCAKCHGDEGHGDAEGAEKLVPPPRDFASRPWRFEPTETSIERVVTSGIPGTSMPAFGATVPTADIELLTAYVFTLAQPAAGSSQADDLFSKAKFAKLSAPRTAPALALEDAAEKKLTLADLHGKVVLLNFWGTSCEHCLARMPQLEQLQQKFPSQHFAAVNICADEDDASAAQQMLSAVASTQTTYVDPTGLVNSRYEVSLMPTIWLMDRNGQLIAKAQGARDWNDPALVTLIESLLEAK